MFAPNSRYRAQVTPACLAEAGKQLPGYVHRAFEAYLQCDRLRHGFLRLQCDTCHAEHMVAFSCKRRGLCPSDGARRMVDSAAWLVDRVLSGGDPAMGLELSLSAALPRLHPPGIQKGAGA